MMKCHQPSVMPTVSNDNNGLDSSLQTTFRRRLDTFGRRVSEIGLVSATLVHDEDIVVAEVVEDSSLSPPDSDVERIVQRLELRNANRVPVPLDVKRGFLRLCDDACKKRIILESSSTNESNPLLDNGMRSQDDLCCILRKDIIHLRNSTRLQVENRTRFTQITSGIKSYFGFRCHSKVLLHLFNRAVEQKWELANPERKQPMVPTS